MTMKMTTVATPSIRGWCVPSLASLFPLTLQLIVTAYSLLSLHLQLSSLGVLRCLIGGGWCSSLAARVRTCLARLARLGIGNGRWELKRDAAHLLARGNIADVMDLTCLTRDDKG